MTALIQSLNKINKKLNEVLISFNFNNNFNENMKYKLLLTNINFINKLLFIFIFINNDLENINMPFYNCAFYSVGKEIYENEINIFEIKAFIGSIENFINLNETDFNYLEIIKNIIENDYETVINKNFMSKFI